MFLFIELRVQFIWRTHRGRGINSTRVQPFSRQKMQGAYRGGGGARRACYVTPDLTTREGEGETRAKKMDGMKNTLLVLLIGS